MNLVLRHKRGMLMQQGKKKIGKIATFFEMRTNENMQKDIK